jgi:hypothetical protein
VLRNISFFCRFLDGGKSTGPEHPSSADCAYPQLGKYILLSKAFFFDFRDIFPNTQSFSAGRQAPCSRFSVIS